MIRHLLSSVVFVLSLGGLSAQEFVQVGMGAGYGQQAYYRLSDDAVTAVSNESWDLAFTTLGLADAGISVNESTTSTFGAPAPEIRLFATSVSSFADTLRVDSLGQRLYNDESSWESGALNGVASPENPFDLGWGDYNPINHSLTGSRVFAIQLRDSSYRKFMIETLSGGAYQVKYARLDGSEEQTATIAKADFPDAPLALFSFEAGEVLPSTGAWDLVFCRYYTKLDDGDGNILDYPVTGILSAPGVEVAEASGVDPASVQAEAYVDSFQTELDIIGYDWKSFDFTTGWNLPADRAYFVKTADGHLWKMVFIDFEGSSTGVTTVEKTDLGIVSSISDPNSNFAEASIYPNPVQAEAQLAFSLKQDRDDLPVQIINLNGQVLWSARLDAFQGFNVFTVPARDLPAGMYLVRLGQGAGAIHLKLMKK